MRFTELIKLQESIKISNADEAVDVITNKRLGVKVPESVLEYAKDKPEDFKYNLDTILQEFNKYKVDYVNGLQVLIGTFIRDYTGLKKFSDAIENNGFRFNQALCFLIKNWKNEWLFKEDDEKSKIKYGDLVDNLLKIKLGSDGNVRPPMPELEIIELINSNDSNIIDKCYEHGSLSKGKGNIEDVTMLYPEYKEGKDIDLYKTDNEGWQLFTSSSFDGERAVAWYGTDKSNMKPTNWCTRAGIEAYWRYNGQGQEDEYDYIDETEVSPLYVIRNLKTGKAWQVSIRGHNDFDFLNEQDHEDEYTKGNLSIFPDELLKKVEDSAHDNYGDNSYETRSLLDVKNIKDEGFEKYGKDERYMYDYLDPESSGIFAFQSAKLGNEIDLGNGICKRRVLNGTMSTTDVPDSDEYDCKYDIFNKDYDNFEYEKDLNDYKFYSRFGKKTGIVYKYYFKDDPDEFMIGGSSGGKANVYFDDYFGRGVYSDDVRKNQLRDAIKHDLHLDKRDDRKNTRINNITSVLKNAFTFDNIKIDVTNRPIDCVTICSAILPDTNEYLKFNDKNELRSIRYPYLFNVKLHNRTSDKNVDAVMGITTEALTIPETLNLAQMLYYQQNSPVATRVSRESCKCIFFFKLPEDKQDSKDPNMAYYTYKKYDDFYDALGQDVKKVFMPYYLKMVSKYKKAVSPYVAPSYLKVYSQMFESIFEKSN